MARFIRLTYPSGLPIRVNIEHIVAYMPDQDSTNVSAPGTFLITTEGSRQVRETVNEIDKLIEPTRT